jgi:predicted lipid-binding transport protein (Tim44 family)
MHPVLLRLIGSVLIFLLSGATEPLLFAQQQSQPPQSSAQTSPQQPAQNSTQPPIELPENPGVSPNAPQANAPATPANQAQQPSGTAVAPSVQVSGSAASKPAGVAIAPPKQHQMRSWLIRFGFIAGAGAALGTVAALSAASPGRVPNSPR